MESKYGNKEKIDNLERLDDIRQLEYDWNGYGSKKIPENVINTAKMFVENINLQPRIFPTGRESVLVEYNFLKDDSYLGFEIFKDEISCFKVPSHRDYKNATMEFYNELDMNKLNQIVDEFCGGKQ